MIIVIEGTPIAKMRVGQSGRIRFNPQKAIEQKMKGVIKSQMAGKGLFTGPVKVHIMALFPRPKKHLGTGKNRGMIKNRAPRFYTIKPDCDNLAKFYCDVMNGIVYEDDKQVVSLSVMKEYGHDARTIIQIHEAKP